MITITCKICGKQYKLLDLEDHLKSRKAWNCSCGHQILSKIKSI